MKSKSTSRGTKATSVGRSPGGLALLESEIADLKERNAHLQRRLEEAEMDAELQVRADRILAIPLPKDT